MVDNCKSRKALTKFFSAGSLMWVWLSALIFITFCIPSVADTSIELGNPGPEDDFLCWGRVPGHITIDPGDAIPENLTLSSAPHDSPNFVGRIGFALSRDQQVELTETLQVPIDPATRSGRFFIAGTAASIAKKDVRIVAEDSSNAAIASLPVMVRVRKNAEFLTDEERDLFLSALYQASQQNNQFSKYWGIHTDAIRMAHQVAFLPWHRVFLLNLERELQAEIPEVALPYWEFDRPSPKLFSTDFIGKVGGLANPFEVEFSITNPLNQFRLTDPRVTPLTRRRNGDLSVSAGINKTFFTESAQGLMTTEIFGPYHGQAHVHIGGLVGSIQRSPADPLFFLLHANVDRAWASWQRHHDRFDRSERVAYDLQGAHFPGASEIHGNFVDDTMWPWDNLMRPTEPINETNTQIRLPEKIGAGSGASSNPMVGDMIDYLDYAGDGSTHNYCYDTVPVGVGSVIDFP